MLTNVRYYTAWIRKIAKVHADMPRPMNNAVKRAVRAYKQLAQEMPKGYKPNLSAICREFKVAKSSLWYALQKK